MPTKKQYYAMIHLGAARLGYTDDAEYRAWLESLCGRRSAKDCTLQELASIVGTLRLCKALDNPRVKAVQGATLQEGYPTAAQWGTVDRLCIKLGMVDGCKAFSKTKCNTFSCKVPLWRKTTNI